MTTTLQTTEDATLESALAEHGWKRDAAAAWNFATSNGTAILEQSAVHDDWLQFELRGKAAPKSKKADALRRNFELAGPGKFLSRRKRPPVLRLDVPADPTAWTSNSDGWNESLHVIDPWRVWVAAVMRLIGEDPPDSGGSGMSDPEGIANEIGRCGWAASVDDGEVRIHFQMPGVFRQARIEQVEGASVKVVAELLKLDGLPSESLQAISLLASEANTRLSLVRFSESPAGPAHALQAEVHFGKVLIPGAWLMTSLEVLDNAIALTARELEALRDPELARLVVTAKAV